MDYENFFESLKYHVAKKGHGGQALICRHTDIPKSYLSRIMNKNRKAGIKTQKKLARFFGLGREEFFEIGRRITLGENPEQALDLLRNLTEDDLMQRLTDAVRKEIATAQLLTKTQLLYKDIVENSGQIIIRFDASHKITYANQVCEQLDISDHTHLLNQGWVTFFHVDYRKKLSEEIVKYQGTGGSFSMEAPSRDAITWYLLTITIFPDNHLDQDLGQLIGLDITEKKKLDERLYFIQHGVEMSFVPTLVINDKARLIYVNRAVCQLLGYTKHELKNMHVWDINPLIPQDGWRQKWAWFEAEENVVFKGQYRRKNGEIISVEFQVSNLKYPDGRRYNVVFVKPEGESSSTP